MHHQHYISKKERKEEGMEMEKTFMLEMRGKRGWKERRSGLSVIG